jgi:hypothetical protein
LATLGRRSLLSFRQAAPVGTAPMATAALERSNVSSGLPAPAKNARTVAMVAAVGSVVVVDDDDDVDDSVALVEVVVWAFDLPLEHAASTPARHNVATRRVIRFRVVEQPLVVRMGRDATGHLRRHWQRVTPTRGTGVGTRRDAMVPGG